MQNLDRIEHAVLTRALALVAAQAESTQDKSAIATLDRRLANTTPSDLDRSQQPVCDTCGISDVSVDGACRWDEDACAWSLQSTFDDDGHCDDCGGECRIKWEPVSSKNAEATAKTKSEEV